MAAPSINVTHAALIRCRLKNEPHYEPTAWLFTMQRLGRALRGWYTAQAELPRELLTLVAQIEHGSGISAADNVVTSKMKPSR